MKITNDYIRDWLDYRIKAYEVFQKNLSVVGGKRDSDIGSYEFDVEQCDGTLHDKHIHLFINQYALDTRKNIFEKMANAVDATVKDEDDGYSHFIYRGHKFYAYMPYSEEQIKWRKEKGLEV